MKDEGSGQILKRPSLFFGKVLLSLRVWCFSSFILLPSSLLGLTFGEVKAEIDDLKASLRLVKSESEKSELCYKLALASASDQEIDQAFQYFLSSLEAAERKSASELKKEEKKLYEEAMAYYLRECGGDPFTLAEEMIERYGEVATEHPEFLHLNFLMSTAYANLGHYTSFFERCYRAYPFMMETFLAYKLRGIICLRLAQHGRSEEDRHRFQELASGYLREALERNPDDPSLYRVLIFLAKDQNNEILIRSYLKKIVEHEASIPRGDIFPYVREAVSLGEFGVGQKIIDQAQAIYDYSRAITVAQEYLNEQRG